MKVLYLGDFTGRGGAASQTRVITRGLADKKGIDLHLMQATETQAPKNLTVPEEDTGIGVPLTYPKNVCSGIEEIDPDIVLAHAFDPTFINKLKNLNFDGKIGYRNGSSIFENELVYPFRKKERPRQIVMSKEFHEVFDFLIVPSMKCAKEMKFLYGDDTPDLIHVPVAVEPDNYIPTDYRENDELKFLIAARLEPNNPCVGVLNAYRRFTQEENTTMNIAGDGRYRNLYRQMIKEYGLEDNVVLPGFLGDDKIKEMMELTDVLLVPSIYHQGVPSVVIEAMAAGSVVVTSDLPAMNEIESPVQIPLERIPAWYEAMQKCADEDWARGKIREELEEVKEYSIERISRIYLKCFEELMNR